MRRTAWLLFGLGLSLVLAACAAGAKKTVGAQQVREKYVPARAEGTTLRVASMNILTAGNRRHPWKDRRRAVADCLRDINPDIFGVQEAEWKQLQFLMDALPGYTCVGRGRDDGHTGGEIMGVFYRTDRFVLKQAEVFWLSDKPEVPGSNTWHAACNRVATVAVLIDRTDGTSLGICNTHLDHVSAEAREKGAALIKRRLPTYGGAIAWVVTGDFNATPGSQPYKNLVGGSSSPRLLDTFALVHPNAPAATSSFHGYQENPPEGARIDWILVTPDFEVLAADICRFKYRGIYPTDHFPVWADLKRKAE